MNGPSDYGYHPNDPKRPDLATLTLAGDPYEMGLAHGRALAGQIAAYSAERVALAATAPWTGRATPKNELLELAAACLDVHREHFPKLVEELEGVAAGSGTPILELLIAGGFTDFVDTVAAQGVGGLSASVGPGAGTGHRSAIDRAAVDNETDDCTAFLVPARGFARVAADPTAGSEEHDANDAERGRAGNGGALAQTWDMHEGSAEYLVLLQGRPRHAPDFMVYTTAGCLGMIGMNEAGLSVGINNLSAADGRIGVTWPFVVRAMLEQETTEAALRVLQDSPLAGGHNYLIMDAHSAGANVEAMPTRSQVTRLEQTPLVHTNHCLHPETKLVERERLAASQADSEARLADAERLLTRSAADGPLDLADLQAITADQASICRVGVAPTFVGTCGAVVMLPASRELWVVAGRPSEGEYQRFSFASTAA